MNYQKALLKDLKQDKSQPRQYFDDEAIARMAVSIKNEGVINPIEVDEDMVIITGERRYRASKLAGLTEVPIKILPKMSYKDRFIRQVQENIHQNTMSTWDTAKAFKKVIDLLVADDPSIQPTRKSGNPKQGYFSTGVKELNELFGISKRYIEELLGLIGETSKMKKLLDEGANTHSAKVVLLQREKGKMPPEYENDIRNLVLNQKDLPRDGLGHIIYGVKRAYRYGEHNAIRELLSKDFNGLTGKQVLKIVESLIPSEENRIKGPADAVDNISNKVSELVDLLDKYPFDGFDQYHKPLAGRSLMSLGLYLQGYLKEMDMSDMPNKDKSKLLK